MKFRLKNFLLAFAVFFALDFYAQEIKPEPAFHTTVMQVMQSYEINKDTLFTNIEKNEYYTVDDFWYIADSVAHEPVFSKLSDKEKATIVLGMHLRYYSRDPSWKDNKDNFLENLKKIVVNDETIISKYKEYKKIMRKIEDDAWHEQIAKKEEQIAKRNEQIAYYKAKNEELRKEIARVEAEIKASEESIKASEESIKKLAELKEYLKKLKSTLQENLSQSGTE